MTTRSLIAPEARVLALFARGAAGRVIRREKSFWGIEVSHPSLPAGSLLVRLSFEAKAQVHHVEGEFSTFAFPVEHPLLDDFLQPSFRLSLTRRPESGGALLEELARVVSEATHGWREIGAYRNPDEARAVLDAGSGLLLAAPEALAIRLEHALRRAGAEVTISTGPAPKPRAKLAILGQSFVVASRFAVKWGPKNPLIERSAGLPKS